MTPKLGHKIALSALVLLVLFFIGGFVYVYMNDQSSVVTSGAKSSSSVSYQQLKPPPPSNPKSSVGVAVEALDTPVTRGSQTSMIISTNSYATCSISVIYNNIVSNDPALSPKVADAYGMITWTWTVPKTTPLGVWPIKVTCHDQTQSGFFEDSLSVVQ